MYTVSDYQTVNLLHYVKVTGDSTEQKRNDSVITDMDFEHKKLEQYERQHNKAGIVKFSVGVFFFFSLVIKYANVIIVNTNYTSLITEFRSIFNHPPNKLACLAHLLLLNKLLNIYTLGLNTYIDHISFFYPLPVNIFSFE